MALKIDGDIEIISGGTSYGTLKKPNNATEADKATNDQDGTNLKTGYARATTPSGGFNDVGNGKALQRSGLYSINTESDWWNLINIRHRNGESDGVSYGMQLISRLTNATSSLLIRKQTGANSWTAWENLYRSKNLYNNTTGTAGTVTLSETSANFTYLTITYYKEESGAGGKIYNTLTISVPNGKLVSLFDIHYANASTHQFVSKIIQISGTSITHKYGMLTNIGTNKTIQACEVQNPIYITRVDGYR